MKRVAAIAVLALTFALSGCMGMGFEPADGLGIDVAKMKAEEIKATADLVKANREKDSAARCVRVPTRLGVATVVELNMDLTAKMRSKATIAPDCTTTIENDTTLLPQPTPSAQPPSVVLPQPTLSTQPSSVLAPLPIKAPATAPVKPAQ